MARGSKNAAPEDTVGTLFKRERMNRKWSQERAGAEFGVHQGTIAKWERGDMPSPVQLPSIAHFVNRPVQDVMKMTYGYEEGELMTLVRELVAGQQELREQIAALTDALGGRAKPGIKRAPTPVKRSARRRTALSK